MFFLAAKGKYSYLSQNSHWLGTGLSNITYLYVPLSYIILDGKYYIDNSNLNINTLKDSFIKYILSN
jgi:hypothetical protein